MLTASKRVSVKNFIGAWFFQERFLLIGLCRGVESLFPGVYIREAFAKPSFAVRVIRLAIDARCYQPRWRPGIIAAESFPGMMRDL